MGVCRAESPGGTRSSPSIARISCSAPVSTTSVITEVVDTGAEQEILAIDGELLVPPGLSARQTPIVEMRYFTGLSLKEVAEAMGLSTRSVEREWRFARAWLGERLAKSQG